LVDLLEQPESESDVQVARAEMLGHPQVQELIAGTSAWGDRSLKRHNHAGHPIYKFSTLADFGTRADDDGLPVSIAAMKARQAPEGAWQTVVNIPTWFGGSGKDDWHWMVCNAPTLLYCLLAFGLDGGPHVLKAVEHLMGMPGSTQALPFWRRHRLPEAQIPIRVVRHAARGGRAQPIRVRPP
jgi:hypothetical protein